MRKLATLDGLRGVAALCIALRHLPLYADHAPQPPLFTESYLAVDFFFVLSGFVIAYAYQHRLAGEMSLGQFFLARLVRLYPLYFLGFILAAPLTIAQFIEGKIAIAKLAGDLTFGILMLPSPAGGALFPTNTPAWSLFFELIANAMFGLLGRRGGVCALMIIVVSAAAVLAVSVWLGWLGFGTSDGPMNAGPEWRSIGAGCIRVLYSFFAGVLVHRLWQYDSHDYASTGVSLSLSSLLIVVLSICPTPTAAISYDLVATIFGFPSLVYFGASFNANAAISAVFRWLGTVSYAVYVLQAPLYGYALHAVPFILHQQHLGFSVTMGVNVMIFLVVGAKAAEVYFDRPVRRRLSEAIAKRCDASAMRLD